jgi:hypothetical protein
MSNLEGGAARLAGVLGLEGTEELHKLFMAEHQATMDVITGFIQDRNNQFGHEDQIPTKDQFVRNTTVTLAVEHIGEFTAALLAADPPSLTSQNVTAQNLFDVRQMWWSRQFLLTRPNDIGRQSQLSMAPFTFSAKEAFLA